MNHPPTHWWRRLFPRSGSPYELFDAAVFLLCLGFIGYVLTDPPATSQQALSAPLDLLPPWVWGTVLTAAGVVGIVCSYVDRWVWLGYRVMLYPCIFWSANFALGILLYGASIRALLSVLLYAWVASRLVRDMPRRGEA